MAYRLFLTTTATIALLAPALGQTQAAPGAAAVPSATDPTTAGADAPSAVAPAVAPAAAPVEAPATAAADAPAAVPPAPASDVVLFPVDRLAAPGVVTTTLRDRSVQEVAGAISVYDSGQLSARRIQTPLGVFADVPNAVATHDFGVGSANAYYLRGLGNIDTIATIDSPVATYVDGIDLGRQNGNDFAFFDVGRVEVRRGPQSILFGRNTNAGAVNVVLDRPTGVLGGYVEGGYGSYDTKFARGSIDVPVGDAVAVKVSGYYRDGEGYARNTTTGERANDSDLAGVRGAVQFKAGERLTWNLSAAYMRNGGENLPSFDCDPRNAANCDGRFVSTGLLSSYRDTTSPFAGLGISGDKAGRGLRNRADTQLYTSHLDYGFGDAATLSLITGVVRMKDRYTLDFADGRALATAASPLSVATGYTRGGYVIFNDSRRNQFSQEVRLGGTLLDGKVDYVVGGEYLRERNTTDFADVATRGAGPLGTATLLADRTIRNKTRAASGYAEVDVHPAERVTLTAGVRYTDDKRSFAIVDNRAACRVAAPPAACLDGAGIPGERTTRIWTPRAALSVKASDTVMVYASATRGYRAGGWNGRGLTDAALQPFGAERTWSYEVGSKTEWLDRRLRVNLTGFYMDTKGLQTPGASVDPVTGVPSFVTQSFAGMRNKGVEAEVVAVPVKGLSLFANLGYQDPEYRGNTVNLVSSVRLPSVTLAGGVSYDYAIPAAGIILTPRVDANYRSKSEFGSPALANSYTEVEAALALRTDDGNWTLTASCANCFDKSYTNSVLFGLPYLSPPRTWQLIAKRVF